MPQAVLALNGGSSSIKFQLAEIGDAGALRRIAAGQIEGIGVHPHLLARDAGGQPLVDRRWPPDQAPGYEALLETLLQWIETHLGGDALSGVGHRVVHGGQRFNLPVRVDQAVLTALTALAPLAPLHQPHNLAPIAAILKLRPDLPQIACFDTGFHHTMPAIATRIALPRSYAEQGVRRYGFHGISYEYLSRRLRETAPDLARGRVVIAHLGNGASLCALNDGRSVETTMGFTALDGLVMGTRCGSLDPGVLLYMGQQQGLSFQQIEQVLYHESGLLGVSGLSSDMRDLLGSGMPAAQEAVALFVYRIARETSALAGVLGGLDGLVFSAGIGEHAPAIRAAVAERLRWLGVEIDPQANARGEEKISTPASRVDVRVLATDEEAMILRHVIEKLAPVG